ncbi:hypothetical protein FB451DRAFT_451246 [Mycena latifolia]|nr:hypothetical protein FB451DRAFT_451246 [Mycena latifolia]
MKLMYHQQALDFMKSHHGVALLPETLEIYWSYLSYVSTSTKIAILEELATRSGSEEDARLLIHSNMVNDLLQFLQSAPLDLLLRSEEESNAILSKLASHSKTTRAAVIEPLVALLRDDLKYFELGRFLRAYLVEAPDAAEAIVAAKGLEYVEEHLVIPGRQRSACNLLAVLAQHESTAAAVIAMKPCKHLVALFR